MSRRIVIALGGNALGSTLSEQIKATSETARFIAELTARGDQIVITHGNGPQVGLIQNAFDSRRKLCPAAETVPLPVCVAMSQGYIGFSLQNALRNELKRRNIKKEVATILTEVVVDPRDEAFQRPTKPIGVFMTREEAQERAQAEGWHVCEDAGRGWRRVVTSPRPKCVVELAPIRTLLDQGIVVIAAGGGGIPVSDTVRGVQGVEAVVDKDFASAKLAEQLNADRLVILTAVEQVSINFGKPDEFTVSAMTTTQARAFAAQGHFAPGSMLPKVEAAVLFAEGGDEHMALITRLDKAGEGLAGMTGTVIRRG